MEKIVKDLMTYKFDDLLVIARYFNVDTTHEIAAAILKKYSKAKMVEGDILQQLRDNKIVELDLTGKKIGNFGAQQLADALRGNKSLRTLKLGSNKIGVDGAIALADALEGNDTLIHLDLGINTIGNRGLEALAKNFPKNLEVLKLVRNRITENGMDELVKFLADSKLQELNLGWNRLNAEGIRRIIENLPATLTELGLVGNRVGDENAILLAEKLADSNLQYLTLYQVNDAGAEALLAAIPESKVIYLRIFSQGLNPEIKDRIHEELQKNKERIRARRLARIKPARRAHMSQIYR